MAHRRAVTSSTNLGPSAPRKRRGWRACRKPLRHRYNWALFNHNRSMCRPDDRRTVVSNRLARSGTGQARRSVAVRQRTGPVFERRQSCVSGRTPLGHLEFIQATIEERHVDGSFRVSEPFSNLRGTVGHPGAGPFPDAGFMIKFSDKPGVKSHELFVIRDIFQQVIHTPTHFWFCSTGRLELRGQVFDNDDHTLLIGRELVNEEYDERDKRCGHHKAYVHQNLSLCIGMTRQGLRKRRSCSRVCTIIEIDP